MVLDTGAVSRGSGNQGSNRERDIRRRFVDVAGRSGGGGGAAAREPVLQHDRTGIILILNTRKRHKGEILLINASKLFSKGRPKNFLEGPNRADRAALRRLAGGGGALAVVTKAEAAKNDLQPVAEPVRGDGAAMRCLPLEEAVVLSGRRRRSGPRPTVNSAAVLENWDSEGRMLSRGVEAEAWFASPDTETAKSRGTARELEGRHRQGCRTDTHKISDAKSRCQIQVRKLCPLCRARELR